MTSAPKISGAPALAVLAASTTATSASTATASASEPSSNNAPNGRAAGAHVSATGLATPPVIAHLRGGANWPLAAGADTHGDGSAAAAAAVARRFAADVVTDGSPGHHDRHQWRLVARDAAPRYVGGCAH